MSQTKIAVPRSNFGRWGALGAILIVAIGGGLSYPVWMPLLMRRIASKPISEGPVDDHAGHADHAGHDHAGHKEENSLELSLQAQVGIGLKVGPVSLSTFERVVSIPGIVIERRGRSRIDITAPLTGVVTKILIMEGEAVTPGQPLFEMRLTHEELVQAQTDLLRTVEELDVIQREVNRLEIAGKDGAIPGKTLLERKYEQQKQEAQLRAQRQSLLLHGLSEQQVTEIIKTRSLFKTLTIRAPDVESLGKAASAELILQVQELQVERGQHVTLGDSLAVLADHSDLLIRGEAFEHDARSISEAKQSGRSITAVLEGKTGPEAKLGDLKIQYLANRVDPGSRTLDFYVRLPNELQSDAGESSSSSFVEWRYKPGQRMLLRVPVEEWPDRIVLSVDAIAQDGVENYVFRSNGDHFDRQAVRVDYRDPMFAVVANDGSLFPGDTVALSGAQQLQLALKNKAGGGVDPHAGHNH
jgi:multidrug efflux pump subunit AcrA (membrane-fusion protein)